MSRQRRSKKRKPQVLTRSNRWKVFGEAPVGERACDHPESDERAYKEMLPIVEAQLQEIRELIPGYKPGAPMRKALEVLRWTGLPLKEYFDFYENKPARLERELIRHAANMKREQLAALKQGADAVEYGPFTTTECRDAWDICEETWRNWSKGHACPQGLTIRKVSRGRWMLSQKLPQRTPTKQKR